MKSSNQQSENRKGDLKFNTASSRNPSSDTSYKPLEAGTIVMTTIPLPELLKHLKLSVKEGYSEITAGMPTEVPEVLNVFEAASLLRIARATLYCWTSSKKIPFHKHGHRVMFYREELYAFMKATKVPSNKELRDQMDKGFKP